MCPFDPCQQVCRWCGVCWHRMMCSCLLAIGNHHRAYSCKHAHLVKMSLDVPTFTPWRPWESHMPESATRRESEPSTPAKFTIGHSVLPGRSNTPQEKQRRYRGSSKMHRISKNKGKKGLNKEYFGIEAGSKEEQHLKRNLPEQANLEEILGFPIE